MSASQKFTSFKISDAELIDALKQIASVIPQLGQTAAIFQFGEDR